MRARAERRHPRRITRPGSSSGAGPYAIALFGEFGVGNIGNEASAAAVIRLIAHAPGPVTATTIARQTAAATATLGVPSVRMTWDTSRVPQRIRSPRAFKVVAKVGDTVRMCRLVKRFDAVLVPGMGGLEAGSVPVWGMPFTIFSVALACRLRSVPFGLIGVGGSAYESWIGRMIFRKLGQWSSHLSFRDVTTRRAFEASGYDTSGNLATPDIAFSLQPPEFEEAAADTVGIGVIEYYGDHGHTETGYAARDAYHSKLAAFGEELLRRGLSVRIIVGDVADRTAALGLYEELIRRCPERSDQVRFAEARDIDELWRQLLTVRFVVASRFHNLVAAAMVGRPMIALSHAVKDDDFMAQVGLTSYVRDIATFDPAELQVCFDRLVDQGDRISQELVAFSKQAAEDTTRLIEGALDQVLPGARAITS